MANGDHRLLPPPDRLAAARRPGRAASGPGAQPGGRDFGSATRVQLRGHAASYLQSQRGAMMSQYMLLLYATEVEGDELAEREAEIPMFLELNRSLEEAGLLVAAGRLHPTTTATTVSAISGEAELTD